MSRTSRDVAWKIARLQDRSLNAHAKLGGDWSEEDAAAVSYIIPMLCDERPSWPHNAHCGQGPPTSVEACQALEQIGRPAVLEVAQAIVAAEQQRAKLPNGQRFTDVKEALSRSIARACWLLRKINGTEDVLRDALGQAVPQIRVAAVRGLAEIKSQASLLALIQALRNDNAGVRLAAQKALEKLTGKVFLFGRQDPEKWSRWWDKKGLSLVRRWKSTN